MGELIFETTQALVHKLCIIKGFVTFLLLLQNVLLDISDFLSELHILEVYNRMDNLMLFVLTDGFPLVLEYINDLEELILVVLHLINDLSFLRFVPSILHVIRFKLLLKVAKDVGFITFLLDEFFFV